MSGTLDMLENTLFLAVTTEIVYSSPAWKVLSWYVIVRTVLFPGWSTSPLLPLKSVQFTLFMLVAVMVTVVIPVFVTLTSTVLPPSDQP